MGNVKRHRVFGSPAKRAGTGERYGKMMPEGFQDFAGFEQGTSIASNMEVLKEPQPRGCRRVINDQRVRVERTREITEEKEGPTHSRPRSGEKACEVTLSARLIRRKDTGGEGYVEQGRRMVTEDSPIRLGITEIREDLGGLNSFSAFVGLKNQERWSHIWGSNMGTDTSL